MIVENKIDFTDAYVIFTGLFRCSNVSIDNTKVFEDYTMWFNRINNGNYAATLQHLNNSYYDTFVNNIFPEINYLESVNNQLNANKVNHLTHKKCLAQNDFYKINFSIKSKEFSASISYFDVFHFPNEVGIFTFKTDLSHLSSIDDITLFISHLRNLNNLIEFNHESIEIYQFLYHQFLNHYLDHAERIKVYNPQLKSYLNVNISNYTNIDFLLYDLGNLAPMGTAEGENTLSPDKSYFDEMISKHKISVYRNWHALSLHDTFTRISINYKDEYKSWENDYFNIFIYCVFLKFNLYLTNSELSDVSSIKSNTQSARNKFLSFINDYYLSHISYKFLPNLLMKKMSEALDIQSEIDRMEVKVSRINVLFQEEQSKNTNLTLISIALIGVFGVILDISEWLIKIGIPQDVIYPYLSIIKGIVIFTILIKFLKRVLRN